MYVIPLKPMSWPQKLIKSLFFIVRPLTIFFRDLGTDQRSYDRNDMHINNYWLPPPSRWYKRNTDASTMERPNRLLSAVSIGNSHENYLKECDIR